MPTLCVSLCGRGYVLVPFFDFPFLTNLDSGTFRHGFPVRSQRTVAVYMFFVDFTAGPREFRVRRHCV